MTFFLLSDFNTSDVTSKSEQILASQLTQLTKQQTTSQSTQWTTTDQYSTKSTEQQTPSQSKQWTEQQTTSQSTKSNLSLASSNLTVQISTTLADRSSTADVILASRSQVSMVTDAALQSSETVESASVTLDSTGPTTQLPSSQQLTMTTEPYSSATHPELIHTSQSMTTSEEQSTTSESSTESQTTPSTKATRGLYFF